MALVKYNNNSISDVTALAGVPSGALVHIKTLTASSDSTISFIDGSSDVVFDSTYPVYFIKFISVHPGTNDQPLTFQGSTTTDGSNFSTTITSTHFEALVRENNSSPSVNYQTSQDLSQSTNFQYIQKDFGSDDKAEALKADRDESYGKFGKRGEEHPDQHIDKGEEKNEMKM